MAHMESTDVHDDPRRTTPAGGSTAAGAADQARLVRVSRLYYEIGETQDEIALRLGITRPHVSKLLKQARSAGIVEIRIVDQVDRPGTIADDLKAHLVSGPSISRQRFRIRRISPGGASVSSPPRSCSASSARA